MILYTNRDAPATRTGKPAHTTHARLGEQMPPATDACVASSTLTRPLR